MTIVFIILGILAFLIGTILLIGLIVKREYTIEREITILKPASTIFDYIRFMKNQQLYNKWMMADPNMKTEVKGTDGTVGFNLSWNSTNNQVGEGAQEITKVLENKQVDCEIRFIRPFAGIAYTNMITSSTSDNEANVKWIFAGRHKYPFNAIFLFLGLEKTLGKDLQESLGNLKGILEK